MIGLRKNPHLFE